MASSFAYYLKTDPTVLSITMCINQLQRLRCLLKLLNRRIHRLIISIKVDHMFTIQLNMLYDIMHAYLMTQVQVGEKQHILNIP